ncbi:SDR family NAD(P)-dependent oxidoreductase [Sulfitobacter guttiformis]|uniref:NAD(P)-dependent dehydrogenase (Short-subunit alcohol dehydrogenase family) n=1 Tax=Sulfitobacter guttiformis TaxID=74349 RepID=A0A420DTC9_9RHOB|nr:SDR family NAD(P)-dependent oxidoreductase [Sulfitobacter guttiformis]KIN74858.1 C factor [Sulfitobacter guttiformis KCTC 32187]RKE97428.1 NAD(P)-dependent dehydrogenase (short-subunit alcohol dehydrogenase family) [Sulfitobacter guttiformis]
MNRFLIIGASGGIGAALVSVLSGQGAEVVELSRSVHGFDITDEASVEAHMDALQGPFGGVIVATGALEIGGAEPEKTIRAVSAKAMADQFAVNAIGPALVLRHAGRLLPREGRSVCAVLTARVGSIGDNRIGGWTSYRAAKAAANQIVHTTAIELARTHKELVCVALHPGTVQTPFTQKYLGRHPAVPAQEAAENLMNVLNGLKPEDTGGFFDWAGEKVTW